MDNFLMNHIMKHFQKETGIDLNEDKTATQRIREAAERAKIELSTMMETEINIPFVSGSNNLQMKLTRTQLEEIIRPIIEKCKKPVLQALKDAKILVGGPTRMPIVKNFVENILGKKSERGLDPMECVSMGASVQGGVLAGEVKDILLLDVTPLTLGIETLGGVRTTIIPANTTIPTKKSQVFSTAEDNQTAVTIHALQGEREMASDNKSLGRFDLVGIPPSPRGIPQVEVTFDIDANGIIHVSAKDKATNKEQSIKISGSQKLNKEEIERMKKEAEDFAEADKKKKEEIEIKNQAEALVYTIDKTIKDLGEKADKKELAEIESMKNELNDAIKNNDAEKIKSKMEEVNKKLHEISTKLYQEAMKQEAKAKDEVEGKSKKGKDDNVVDAEVVDDK